MQNIMKKIKSLSCFYEIMFYHKLDLLGLGSLILEQTAYGFYATYTQSEYRYIIENCVASEFHWGVERKSYHFIRNLRIFFNINIFTW